MSKALSLDLLERGSLGSDRFRSQVEARTDRFAAV
jgi:hypothetical protein